MILDMLSLAAFLAIASLESLEHLGHLTSNLFTPTTLEPYWSVVCTSYLLTEPQSI